MSDDYRRVIRAKLALKTERDALKAERDLLLAAHAEYEHWLDRILTMILTKATIPMCPKCGEALSRREIEPARYLYDCDACSITCGRTQVNWGYYSNAAEVAREMREAAGLCDRNGWRAMGRRLMRAADRLDPQRGGGSIDESTQAVVVARLKALPAESVAQFWRAFMVDRVRDLDRHTMAAVNQILKNLEKEAGIR